MRSSRSFSSKTALILCVGLISVTFAFQNCGKFVAQKSDTVSSVSDPTIPQLEHSAPRGTSASRVRIGDRTYIANLVSEIFGPDLAVPGDFQLIGAIVNPLILGNFSAFGGPCDVYEDNCDHTRSQVAVIPGSSASRAGFMHQVCERILESDFALRQFFVINLGPTGGLDFPALSIPNLKQAYSAFVPDRPVQSETVNALASLSLELRDLQYSRQDQWRYLLFTICISPEWQVP